MEEHLLKVEKVKTYFPVRGNIFSRKNGTVYAVDDVSFSLKNGEILGLVGESGCGKTTLGRTILRLIEPTGGKISFRDTDITKLSNRAMKPVRRNMQMIFQDPYSSLNPRMKVGKIISEPLIIHKLVPGDKLKEKSLELLETVGLAPEHYDRYPHEFSGGQRQRIGIARALALQPELIIADEPVSALDVSIQAQIVNLLMDLKDKFNLTYIFISHDLNLVRFISDTMAVMYLGKIVEYGKSKDIYNNPKHPYTKILLNSVPVADPKTKRKRIIIAGDIPSPIDRPTGCHFHPRCPERMMPRCQNEEPKLLPSGEVLVSCLLYQ
ncbi:MAG: dipeptide ABC transporter ATP-binding protein [Candidatus Schekmanbacteria bacterium]|nr:dipeptide ABC transporter ATP-binding protein [Candidatus Schekmanbacteria bacterium]